MTKPLVLCLGNDILSDDGFGPAVARHLETTDSLGCRADILFAPVAGFHLLDLLQDREQVLIVDSIQNGGVPVGHLELHDQPDFSPGRHLSGSHQIGLPTALELGRRLKLPLPERISVLTVEVGDTLTVSEELSSEVAAAIPTACRLVEEWIGMVDRL